MNTIKIIGIGPGSTDYILPIAYKAVDEADYLIGAKRHLEVFKKLQKETYCYDANLKELVNHLREIRLTKKVAILVSGDPGFYSLLDFIQNQIGKEKIEVIPGISSFQYLFSKINRSYKEYSLLSLHGRDVDVQERLKNHKGIFLLTDGIFTPSKIAKELIKGGYGDFGMVVGEELSYEEERIEEGRVKDFADKEFSNLCVVVIENDG